MDGLIKKILVYIDGSEHSITAAQYAICLARDVRAELYALYVVNTRALADLVKAHIFHAQEEEEYQRDLKEDAVKYLNHIKALASSKGVTIVTINASGTVHQEIKARIEEHGIDLLVIGEVSKIRSRRDEFFNETERAMRNVGCSVLIVKDEDRVYNMFQNM